MSRAKGQNFSRQLYLLENTVPYLKIPLQENSGPDREHQ